MSVRFTILAAALAAGLASPQLASAQVDCWAPREQQDSVATPRFAPIRQTLLTIEEIIRRNTAYQSPPEPVRMRTTIAAGPDASGGARIFVRAYPPVQTTANIRIWTTDRCDVIPQADRVAASVGEVYAFINYSIQEQFLGADGVPKYQGEFAGYPIYNGWIVMTKDGRLPWIPQTLGDRLDREERERQRRLDDWQRTKADRHVPDGAALMATYELLKKNDAAGADKFLATMREVSEQVRAAKAAEPRTDAHLQRQLQAVREYRATFSAKQLESPAVWMDKSGDGKRRLDARIAVLRQLPEEEQREVDALGRDARSLERQAQAEARAAGNGVAVAALRARANDLGQRVRDIRKAHLERALFPIQDASADYDLANLRPGIPADAMAFKVDPTFPNMADPFRPQVIALNFWSKSDARDQSPRTLWLRQAKDAFDLGALAALLR